MCAQSARSHCELRKTPNTYQTAVCRSEPSYLSTYNIYTFCTQSDFCSSLCYNQQYDNTLWQFYNDNLGKQKRKSIHITNAMLDILKLYVKNGLDDGRLEEKCGRIAFALLCTHLLWNRHESMFQHKVHCFGNHVRFVIQYLYMKL